ncbi:hypothetical protein TUBRATIS_16560 [Tubulinosema ratisbonensis]|uniref:Uncharacterized protein n=1 Tax=Tubulinosema ratisbonensis TaxID=291195 RepID=A0A437AKZ2_9MICR|nr:hypothetical protein TUBRATIS_16560 [Tubulinosema ratisbonensis]
MYKKGKISLTDQILSSFFISHFIVFLLVTIILIPISFTNYYLFLFLLFFYLSFNFFICLFVYFESFLFNYFLSLVYFLIILALLLTVDFTFIPFLEKYQFKLEMIGTFLKSFPYFNLLIYFLSWLYTSFDSKKEFGQLELFRLNWYGRNEMFSFSDKYFYLFVGVIVFYSLFIIFYGFMCVKSKMNLFYRYKLKK